MIFRYVKEGAALGDNGTVHRVLSENADNFLSEKYENDSPKFMEVAFRHWSFPKEWNTSAGILDPNYGLLNAETGEPFTMSEETITSEEAITEEVVAEPGAEEPQVEATEEVKSEEPQENATPEGTGQESPVV